MDATAQVWIYGCASALFFCLALQQPSVAALRWWIGASGIGLAAALLESIPAVPGELLGSLVLLCLCAQMGCIVCGFLCRSSQRQDVRHVWAASLLPGLRFLIWSGGAVKSCAVTWRP